MREAGGGRAGLLYRKESHLTERAGLLALASGELLHDDRPGARRARMLADSAAGAGLFSHDDIGSRIRHVDRLPADGALVDADAAVLPRRAKAKVAPEDGGPHANLPPRDRP